MAFPFHSSFQLWIWHICRMFQSWDLSQGLLEQTASQEYNRKGICLKSSRTHKARSMGDFWLFQGIVTLFLRNPPFNNWKKKDIIHTNKQKKTLQGKKKKEAIVGTSRSETLHDSEPSGFLMCSGVCWTGLCRSFASTTSSTDTMSS